jgi:integrase
MARVYRRKDRAGLAYKTYTADFQYRGVRVSENTGAETKAQALQWVKDKKWQIKQDEASGRSRAKSKRLTIGAALRKYWEERLCFTRTGQRSDSYRLLRLGHEIGTEMLLDDLTTAEMVRVVSKKRSSGKLKNATINRELNIIRALHNHARDVWEYPGLRVIAWKKVRLKAGKPVTFTPTPEQVKLLCMCAKPRLAQCIMFAALTGLRLDEIKQLQWDDLRLERNPPEMTVRGKGEEGETKDVILPLSSVATSLVSLIPRGQSSHVFDMKNFQRDWLEARTKAGLRRIRFHDLRHAFATLYQTETKDPLTLRDAMRHSDISTSLGYAHADSQRLLPSLEAVAKRLIDSLPTSNNSSETESPEPEGESGN